MRRPAPPWPGPWSRRTSRTPWRPTSLSPRASTPTPSCTAGRSSAQPTPQRQRSRRWVLEILKAWDECCAFCGYDGRLGSTPVGLEAAHVRWFNLGGPDDLDNGLALCSLHHKLFDRGALGLSPDLTVVVSPGFTARTEASKRVYDLHGRELQPRPGAATPAEHHRAWHALRWETEASTQVGAPPRSASPRRPDCARERSRHHAQLRPATPVYCGTSGPVAVTSRVVPPVSSRVSSVTCSARPRGR